VFLLPISLLLSDPLAGQSPRACGIVSLCRS